MPIDGAIESERTAAWTAKNGADRAIPQAEIADITEPGLGVGAVADDHDAGPPHDKAQTPILVQKANAPPLVREHEHARHCRKRIASIWFHQP